MSSEARPRRRWFQFSLWSLMFLMSVVASYFAGLAYHRDIIRRLRADLEQAKAEQARMRVEEQWVAIKKQVSGSIENAEADFIRAKEEQAEADAILDNVKALGRDIEAATGRLVPTAEEPHRKAAPAARLESPHRFLRRFRIDEISSPATEDSPLENPRTRPELQFDQPLIDRTIV